MCPSLRSCETVQKEAAEICIQLGPIEPATALLERNFDLSRHARSAGLHNGASRQSEGFGVILMARAMPSQLLRILIGSHGSSRNGRALGMRYGDSAVANDPPLWTIGNAARDCFTKYLRVSGGAVDLLLDESGAAEMKERIGLMDTPITMIVKLSEGNPGAARVLAEFLKHHDTIDPHCMGMIAILGFDTLGLYGSRIWMLYKDVCGQNLALTIGVLRAWQLGFISESELNSAIDGRGTLDIDSVKSQVKARRDFDFDFDPYAKRPELQLEPTS